MSDRAVVNTCLENQLDQRLGKPLNKFKCQMHPLDSFAHATEKDVKTFENQKALDVGVREDEPAHMPFLQKGESEAKGLIRASSKIFHSTKYSLRVEMTRELRQAKVTENGSVFPRYVGDIFYQYYLLGGKLSLYSPVIESYFRKVPPSEEPAPLGHQKWVAGEEYTNCS